MADKNGNNWFDDDPEWQELKRQSELTTVVPKIKKPTVDKLKSKLRSINPKNIPKQTKKVDVSLKLSIPSIKFSVPKLPSIPKPLQKLSRKARIGGSAAVILIIAIFLVTTSGDKNIEKTDTLGKSSTAPTYDTVLPGGKESNTTNGKLRFDPDKQVASFTDTIGPTTITVSQQPIPENFKNNIDEEVKKLAEGFSATEIINESNPKAYLGNDVKGAQTVIFHKNGVLVFILSSRAIEKYQWAEYITLLQ